MAPITIKLLARPLEMEIEVGSLSEFLGYAEANKADISRFLALGAEYDGGEEVTTSTHAGVAEGASAAAATGESAPVKRGRKPKNQPDPATAVAPAPIPAPAPASAPPAVPTPPVAVSPALQQEVAAAAESGTIPSFLQRSPAPPAPAAAVAPPPVLPSAPPTAPAAPTPPVSALAPKIIAEIAKRAAGSPDGGAGIQGWLVQTAAAYGMIAPGASYVETEAVLPFQGDDKLKPIADALNIA